MNSRRPVRSLVIAVCLLGVALAPTAVATMLVETFGIAGVGEVEDDIAAFLNVTNDEVAVAK